MPSDGPAPTGVIARRSRWLTGSTRVGGPATWRSPGRPCRMPRTRRRSCGRPAPWSAPGRSGGDEPSFMGQVRWADAAQQAIPALERGLARGEVSPASLAAMQALLEDEARHPMALIALRGERAALDEMLGAVALGERDVSA